jgi:hypothetical protein
MGNEEVVMKIPGFDKPLYLLPFDHRGSFVTTFSPDILQNPEFDAHERLPTDAHCQS